MTISSSVVIGILSTGRPSPAITFATVPAGNSFRSLRPSWVNVPKTEVLSVAV